MPIGVSVNGCLSSVCRPCDGLAPCPGGPPPLAQCQLELAPDPTNTFDCNYCFTCEVACSLLHFSPLKSEHGLPEVPRPRSQAREGKQSPDKHTATFDWSGMLSGSIYSTLVWGRKDLRLKNASPTAVCCITLDCVSKPPTLGSERPGTVVLSGSVPLRLFSLSSRLVGATSGQTFS